MQRLATSTDAPVQHIRCVSIWLGLTVALQATRSLLFS
jgi:hypothetical protein